MLWGNRLNKVTRPVLRYRGGKWRMAPWIISHFPKHKIYCEPFGGGASVLLRKLRSFAEIYNDLDGEVVNVFRILRDLEQAKKLLTLIQLTPYAREEYDLTFKKSNDPIERARRTIARSFMGYSSDAATRKGRTGFRCGSRGTNAFTSQDWQNYPKYLIHAINRLQGVLIENKSALEVIGKFDTSETLFYLDPPYLPETRYYAKGRECYRHELTKEEHIELSGRLMDLEGMVIISGYPSELYDELYYDWSRDETETIGQAGNSKGSKKNTEVLWISPRAKKTLPLFEKVNDDSSS